MRNPFWWVEKTVQDVDSYGPQIKAAGGLPVGGLMSEVKASSKTLLEKIYDDLFQQLGKDKDFTTELIDDLKKLAKTGDLKKALKLQDALRRNRGANHEVA